MTPPALVWLNGDFVPAQDAKISAFDRGLHFGDGLYETLLAIRGQPRHFHQHWARLRASAEHLAIPLAATPLEVEADADGILRELLTRASLTHGRARIKILLTRGVNHATPWTLTTERPTLMISAIPEPEPRKEPLALGMLPVRRDPADELWQHKTLNLLGRALARATLMRSGLDDGLILNTAGRVCEATTSNLFALLGERVVTPPVTEGCLKGTVRARLLALMRNEHWPVAEEPLTPEDLHRADAVWLSNAIIGALPVGSLEGRPLTMSDTGRKRLHQVQAMASA